MFVKGASDEYEFVHKIYGHSFAVLGFAVFISTWLVDAGETLVHILLFDWHWDGYMITTVPVK